MTLKLLPIGGEDSPNVEMFRPNQRGVALAWQPDPEGEPDEWMVRGLGFTDLLPHKGPPVSEKERRTIVLLAYEKLACLYPIPSASRVFYEVKR